jgi:hypothetical protein
MVATYERRALAFNGKPVLVYVSASASAGTLVLARCRGVSMLAEEEDLGEREYIARIQRAVRELGFEATVEMQDERQIVFDVRRAREARPTA